jgi:hypothetical protein
MAASAAALRRSRALVKVGCGPTHVIVANVLESSWKNHCKDA